MKPLLVFGARPNFMKIAPVYREMKGRQQVEPLLIHTGQHFDREMSESFIEALSLPSPDYHLAVAGGSQAFQIAEVMKKLEPIIETETPDVTVVVGDVNATIAAALVSSTHSVPVAHVEAGLRSRDWAMPEERNRLVTDRLSAYLLTPSPDADENLRAEGFHPSRIFRVGNVMIDSLDAIQKTLPHEDVLRRFQVEPHTYALTTLHRPSNVDNVETLTGILDALSDVNEQVPILFPIHPRTRKSIENFGLQERCRNFRQLPPLSYPEFVSLMTHATMVLTDSGGIQEEAIVLGVPCITLRENTERPITVELGGNRLVGIDPDKIRHAASEVLAGARPKPIRPELWDGRAAGRIVDVLQNESPSEIMS